MIPAQIIDGCKRKEQDSFRDCYNICAPYVYSIIKQYIKDQELRKDAMQETFAQAFQGIENYDRRLGLFKSWISTIAVRQSINVLRKNKHLNFLTPIDDKHDLPNPIVNKIDVLDYDTFQNLIIDMPTGYKTIVLLFYLEGYSHNEIASILNISANTSKSQLNRGVSWLNRNVSHKLKDYIHG